MSATTSSLLHVILIVGLGGCVPGGGTSGAIRNSPNLSCLDRATATAIRIENGSRDSGLLRPCKN
ncbi:hypothetical protein [Jannaschia aquimarina]|nr:hypothetical protein [Jannaschia aquimarina]